MFFHHHHHCMPRFHMPFMSFGWRMPFMPFGGCHNGLSAGLGFALGMGAVGLAGKVLDMFA